MRHGNCYNDDILEKQEIVNLHTTHVRIRNNFCPEV